MTKNKSKIQNTKMQKHKSKKTKKLKINSNFLIGNLTIIKTKQLSK